MRTALLPPNTQTTAGRLLAAIAVACSTLLALAGTASAQYGGGGAQLFLEQSRVPVDQSFGVFGTNCPAGSLVEITIEGVPGVLGDATATADGNYAISGLALPDGLAAGTDHTVQATCSGNVATVMMTLVCPSGDDPVAGSCEDGSDGIVGGAGPTTTTTTTTTSTSTTTVPDDAPSTTTLPDGSDVTTGIGDGDSPSGGSPSGGSPSGGSDSDGGLAFTGAGFSELLVQFGVSLFALGFVLVMVARRRDPHHA